MKFTATLLCVSGALGAKLQATPIARGWDIGGGVIYGGTFGKYADTILHKESAQVYEPEPGRIINPLDKYVKSPAPVYVGHGVAQEELRPESLTVFDGAFDGGEELGLGNQYDGVKNFYRGGHPVIGDDRYLRYPDSRLKLNGDQIHGKTVSRKQWVGAPGRLAPRGKW